MKIIVWLWNPWEKYSTTRHNIGFIFLNIFREKNNFSDWKYESKFTADISHWDISWEKVILVKPQTFMNLSGESLQKISQFYKLDTSQFIIIFDDISLEFWKVRFRDKWSAGWHNGAKSIIQYFSDSWKRIKVWVGLDDRYDVSDWVLWKMSEEELIDLENEVYDNIDDTLKKNI